MPSVVYFIKHVLQGYRLYYHTNLLQAKEIFLFYSTFLLAYQTSSYSFAPTRPRIIHFYNKVLCSRLKRTEQDIPSPYKTSSRSISMMSNHRIGAKRYEPQRSTCCQARCVGEDGCHSRPLIIYPFFFVK